MSARALALALVPTALGACLTTPPPRPDIEVQVEPDARGTACGVTPELVFGSLPEGATELARVHARSRPRPLARYQRALVRVARERCAAGVSVVRAEEEQGGVVTAEAILWSRAVEGAAP